MITQLIQFAVDKIPQAQISLPKAQINDGQFQNLLGAVFALAGAVAVVFIILGGLKYTTSQGNAADLQKGKDMIVYSLVGLVVIIMAFAIVQLVTGQLFDNS